MTQEGILWVKKEFQGLSFGLISRLNSGVSKIKRVIEIEIPRANGQKC